MKQGWGSGAGRIRMFSRSRMFLALGAEAAWKKQGAGARAAPKKSGAGAAKNMRLLYRLLEDKTHKEIVHLLLFFR